MYLGIDAGGTHTDAVIVENGKILANAKVKTRHDNLPRSVEEVLSAVFSEIDCRRVSRVTLGTTLAVNAVVQGKTDKVGLFLSAGPGLAPERFSLGNHVCVVPGGLDHRGREVSSLDTSSIKETAMRWRDGGINAFAVVGKFSPRNPEHENKMLEAVSAAIPAENVSCGHRLSGTLNFPRRIATAYYNAAVHRIHGKFVDAVEKKVRSAGISAPIYLLKADGGSVPLSLSRSEPVQSILSGPAASVMGVLALCGNIEQQDTLLLDIGGTTTDIALYVDGSPVLDRDGMILNNRSTLVRALATVSIGVGGDSAIQEENGKITVGPERLGPAAAFDGAAPTLLDALNILGPSYAGNIDASRSAMQALSQKCGMPADKIAQTAVDNALSKIVMAVRSLVERVNSAPVYTLKSLFENKKVMPQKAWIVGGPSRMLCQLLEEHLAVSADVPPFADVANAVGAALTQPTVSVELFADTGAGTVNIPVCGVSRRITSSYSPAQAEDEAKNALAAYLRKCGIEELPAEVIESDVFATLDDSGRGNRDIHVVCQVSPDIAEHIAGE